MKIGSLMLTLALLGLVHVAAMSAPSTNHDSEYSASTNYDLAKNLAKIRKIVYAQRHDLDWTREAWTADDHPYLLVQDNVDSAIAQGQKPETLLARYRGEALAHPDDVKALFRWGYTAYRAASQVEVAPSQAYLRFETPRSINSVQGLMMKKYVPSYQYARLLFLLLNFNAPYSQTGDLGERLLQHSPGDKQVKYDMLVFRSSDARPAVRQQTRLEAEHLAQQGSPDGYWVLADIYLRMFTISKFPHADKVRTQPIADKAVAALRRYVQLTPPQSGKRQAAERQIIKIEQDQAQIVAGTYR